MRLDEQLGTTGARLTSSLPATWYHDPQIYQRERAAIFWREWLPIGFEHQFGEPGSFVAVELAGRPIVVIKGVDLILRGFHNVCRHRGGPLVPDGSGRTRALVCGYHGWGYDLEGRLIRARDFGDAEDFDRSAITLFSVRVDVWRGIVFATFDADAPPLRQALAAFEAVCPTFDLASLPVRHELHTEQDANWKNCADNYLEGYHIPIVHPRLAREIDVQRYTVETGERWVLHSAPARDSRTTSGRWLWRFPNLAVNVYPEGVNVEWLMPVSSTRTRLSFHYFFAGTDNNESLELSATILEEDRKIVEAVQRNLQAGVYDRGPLSPKHENGLVAFQGWVRSALQEGPALSRG